MFALVLVLMIGDLDVFSLVYLFDGFCDLTFDFEFGYLVGFGCLVVLLFCFSVVFLIIWWWHGVWI